MRSSTAWLPLGALAVGAVLVAVVAVPALALPERPTVSYSVAGGLPGVLQGVRLRSAGMASGSGSERPARDYAAFYGVPYAEAPTGQLRYMPPRRVGLPERFVATNESSPACLQQRRPPDDILGDEDCLSVNIFTPNYDEPNLDVLVYIHGGGFMYGIGPRTGLQFLMDRDVVFVSIEYRVGILGFLSFEDEQLPGNLGLLDQVEALRWIQDNIWVFGGNNKSVTLVGSSAGSASCLMHSMSSMSKGLFHRIIGLSGSPLNPWTQQHSARENAERVAELTNCTRNSTAATLDCLRLVDGRSLVALERKHFQGWKEHPFSPFAPVVDRWSKSPFLADEPHRLLKNQRVASVPMILSLTTEEGLYTASEFITKPQLVEELDANWPSEAPKLLHFHDGRVTDAMRADVARRVREHYMKNASLADSHKQLIQLMSDRNFVVGVAEHARMQAAIKAAPVYFYLFGYRGQYSLSAYESQGYQGNLGVSHADDLQYPIEHLSWSDIFSQPNDILMRAHFVDMWVSFANKSIPALTGVTWDPVTRRNDGELNYLDIMDPNNMTMASARNVGQESFWKSLPLMENGDAQWSSSVRTTASSSLVIASLGVLSLVMCAAL